MNGADVFGLVISLVLFCYLVYALMVRPDTKVTVLVPRRRYVGFWRRVLHDQTSAELTKVLGHLDNVNVTLVPFRLRHRGGLRPVPSTSTETAATRSSNRRSAP